MEERNIKISIEKARDWYNRGGEYKELALSAFTENEITTSALPNTWEEFCNMYPVKDDEWYISASSNIIRMSQGKRYTFYNCNILPSLQSAKAHLAQMQLEQLRDCYRQGWLPDWSNSKQCKWFICFNTDKFTIKCNFNYSQFLSFQSEEIARKFLNNFKGFIETAGDLI